ncbi:hypothetical protein ZHAS_00004123 [Anopheles sinensis]|uniref:Uncharacterized protein n=1 Tax=Anopheles sinensis TaxID=74873 RepID=A0A084VG55_ANOSI|nr:hypothetical protein ZHAS_00004123 [Anopheles sinensis]
MAVKKLINPRAATPGPPVRCTDNDVKEERGTVKRSGSLPQGCSPPAQRSTLSSFPDRLPTGLAKYSHPLKPHPPFSPTHDFIKAQILAYQRTNQTGTHTATQSPPPPTSSLPW